MMALMAVLATLIIGAITIARKSAKYAEARSEMLDIRAVFETFLIKEHELPPKTGSALSPLSWDFCDACRLHDGTSKWPELLAYLKDKGYLGEDGVTRYTTDPWGQYYAYDDNYGSGWTYSHLCTSGPDGIIGIAGGSWAPKGDDECQDFKHEAVTLPYLY